VQTVTSALAQQNAVVPGGYFETRRRAHLPAPERRFRHCRSDPCDDHPCRRARAADRRHRHGDARGFVEPPAPRFRFQGQDALGLGVSMAKGATSSPSVPISRPPWHASRRNLPVGMELAEVASQPDAVKRSIDEFVHSLAEAVIIVLVVCFFSLGCAPGWWWRCPSRWCWG
jgi:multidrug efflux pump